MSSKFDGRLTTPPDEPSPAVRGRAEVIPMPPPAAPSETAQYADEEVNTRDHYPRRLRGTLPENRRWWIPGLKFAWDTWKEAHAGWKGIAIGVLATSGIVRVVTSDAARADEDAIAGRQPFAVILAGDSEGEAL